MVVTILGLLLHATQTIGSLWYLPETPTPTIVVSDLVGFILPSYLLLIVSSFRLVFNNLCYVLELQPVYT